MESVTDNAVLLQKGHYITLYELQSGKLRAVLNRGLKDEYRDDVLQANEERGQLYAFEILFDDFHCNGWEIYSPEQVGALTDRIMFGCEYEYEDDVSDNYKRLGKVYFEPNYETINFIEILYQNGYYDFDFEIVD